MAEWPVGCNGADVPKPRLQMEVGFEYWWIERTATEDIPHLVSVELTRAKRLVTNVELKEPEGLHLEHRRSIISVPNEWAGNELDERFDRGRGAFL